MRENYFVAIFSALFLGCRVRLHTRSDDGCASSCGELFMKAGWHRGIILFREALKDSKDNRNNNQQPPASGALCTPHLLQAAGMGSPLLLGCHQMMPGTALFTAPAPAPMLRWPRRLRRAPVPCILSLSRAESSTLRISAPAPARVWRRARQWLAAVTLSGWSAPCGCQHQLIQSKINTRAGHN